MKRIATYVAALAIMSMTAVSCASGNADAKTQSSDADEQQVKTEEVVAPDAEAGKVTDLNDDAVMRPDTKVNKLTILDFNATWCVPCKKLTPAFEKAAEKFGNQVNFYSVDIDRNPETASAFGVRSVPTVVFITPEGTVDSYVGLTPFVGGIPENAEADALTEGIYNNLSERISKAL